MDQLARIIVTAAGGRQRSIKAANIIEIQELQGGGCQILRSDGSVIVSAMTAQAVHDLCDDVWLQHDV